MNEQIKRLTPHRRATIGAISGSFVTIAVWVAQTTTGLIIPAEVSAAITTMVMFGVTQWVT